MTGLKGMDVASGSPWQDSLTPGLETRPRVICKPTPFRGWYLTFRSGHSFVCRGEAEDVRRKIAAAEK